MACWTRRPTSLPRDRVSDIFGLVDPSNTVADRLRDAADRVAPHRGAAVVVRRADAVFGAFVRGTESHPIVESHDGISVADARIDAVRAESATFEAAGAIGSDATALLAEVLERRGVEALDDVAGKYAFARFDGTRLLLARDAFAMRTAVLGPGRGRHDWLRVRARDPPRAGSRRRRARSRQCGRVPARG